MQQHNQSADKETKQRGAATTENAPAFAETPFFSPLMNARQILYLQRTVGNRVVSRLLAPVPAAPAPRIQRFQAGDSGHAAIERDALAIQFSDEEINQTYYGNWLRDFSQLGGLARQFPPLLDVLNLLAYSEFGHGTTLNDLGGYVASEHMDNPEGGGTVEDPAVRADPERLRAALAELSPEQQAEYWAHEAQRAEITRAAAVSGLPEYIERGKLHAKNKLRQAISDGRTPLGLQHMGDALHAVEDYFSHSNFTDAALWILHNEGNAQATILVNRMIERLHGVNPALLGNSDPNSSAMPIVTGTYGTTSDSAVSLLETIKTQIEREELTPMIVRSLIQQGRLGVDLISEMLCGPVGGVLGGMAGIVPGGVEGAARGYESGAMSGYASGRAAGSMYGPGVGEAMGEIEGMIGGVTGGISGFFSGLWTGGVEGARAGREGASLLCQRWGQGILGVAELAALSQLEVVRAQISHMLEVIADVLVQASGIEADARGLAGPTHSELAKDAPDHPLFGVATQLAAEADRAIGEAMPTAWEDASNPASAESVTALVDVYVSDPSRDAWWRPILTAALSDVHP
ncbi:MAG: hypothetical protein HXY40_14540 [Chloroflexi bacterium]|nr:hypothetical protein [Chloroflexota bacterium]